MRIAELDRDEGKWIKKMGSGRRCACGLTTPDTCTFCIARAARNLIRVSSDPAGRHPHFRPPSAVRGVRSDSGRITGPSPSRARSEKSSEGETAGQTLVGGTGGRERRDTLP